MNYNKVILVGRLTRDPEIRDANGTKVVTFSIASNRSFTKKNGERSENTLFIDAELWGPAAEVIANRAVKGTEIMIDGPLEMDKFQAKDGSTRTKYKVRVDYFQLGQGSVTPEGVATTSSSDTDNEPF